MKKNEMRSSVHRNPRTIPLCANLSLRRWRVYCLKMLLLISSGWPPSRWNIKFCWIFRSLSNWVSPIGINAFASTKHRITVRCPSMLTYFSYTKNSDSIFGMIWSRQNVMAVDLKLFNDFTASKWLISDSKQKFLPVCRVKKYEMRIFSFSFSANSCISSGKCSPSIRWFAVLLSYTPSCLSITMKRIALNIQFPRNAAPRTNGISPILNEAVIRTAHKPLWWKPKIKNDKIAPFHLCPIRMRMQIMKLPSHPVFS